MERQLELKRRPEIDLFIFFTIISLVISVLLSVLKLFFLSFSFSRSVLPHLSPYLLVIIYTNKWTGVCYTCP